MYVYVYGSSNTDRPPISATIVLHQDPHISYMYNVTESKPTVDNASSLAYRHSYKIMMED